MEITREYLEKQLASLTQQAEQAFAAWHNANGAIAATRHLLEVLDAEDGAPDQGAPSVADSQAA